MKESQPATATAMPSRFSFFASADVPPVQDAEIATRGIAQFCDAVQHTDTPDLHEFARNVTQDAQGAALISAIYAFSPYLFSLLTKEAETFRTLCERGITECWREFVARFQTLEADNEKALMAELRRAKRQAALMIAIADITGQWDLPHVTAALSDFAERSLSRVVDFLLQQGIAQGKLTLPDPKHPGIGSGFIVLGMGKLGACELNYSSDIDLIILFDRESMPYTGGTDIQKFCVELARSTVRLMQDRTADGYVFRTDLRLRPDPSSTPMAVSVSGAMTYYESVGQNWERAALIKARPVAGDIAAGQEFLTRLRPFIWRKSLDFAAIADIQSVKRQIDAKAGEIPDDLLGYNVKLGRGGIREIEFFGQTQQLIWGGRLPELRTQPTCTTIHALVKANKVKPEVAEALIEAYDYLRRLEHRLQMVADQQTHSLPETEPEMESIAHFMGYPDSQTFRTELLATLTTVKLHYTALFSESAPLGNQGNLVFTGTDDDPDTLNTLAAMGFTDPRMVSQSIRSWHFGNARATRTKRARELITEITPSLLRLLTATGQPDVAFRKFDEFVKYLPAGVQLFSLFHSNPALLKLVAEIMGNAPALADVLSKRPSLFDAVLLPDFYASLPTRTALENELDAMLSRRRDFEDGLTSLCRFANERRFQAGVHLLRGLAAPSQVSETLSTIAEAVLARLLALVKEQFVSQYGRIKDGTCAIMALGKLGARELTFGSDLDLVFAYSVSATDTTSNGTKPLPANVYYERLAQRVIHACTSLTPEGMLYEVDTRLRPYGKDGPLASRVESIEEYYLSHAWTFERMALTRARAVAGDPALCKMLDVLIRTELTRPRDVPTLAHDILDMRLKIEAQHATDNPWNVKYIRGGLVDLEFIAQFLQLAHAHAHPDILSNHTAQVFEHCGELKLLTPSVALGLRSACAYTTSVQSILRLCAGSSSRFDEAATAEGLKRFLAQTLGEKSFENLKEGLMLHQTRVKGWFEQIITSPFPSP